jgi:hypothetical protein
VAVVVAMVASAAPAAALGFEGARQRLAEERAVASAVVEGGGGWVAALIARLGALLSVAWGEARGDIVPGAAAPNPTTTATETGGW